MSQATGLNRGSLVPEEVVREAVSAAVLKVHGLPSKTVAVEESYSAAWVACVEAERDYNEGKGAPRQFFWRVAYRAALDALRDEVNSGIPVRRYLRRWESGEVFDAFKGQEADDNPKRETTTLFQDLSVKASGEEAVVLREKVKGLEDAIREVAQTQRKARQIPEEVIFRLFVQWKAGATLRELAADPECPINATQLFARFSAIEKKL